MSDQYDDDLARQDEEFFKDKVESCWICNRPLNTEDPMSKDCGGDCLSCIQELEMR